jgi:hypothetical protein
MTTAGNHQSTFGQTESVMIPAPRIAARLTSCGGLLIAAASVSYVDPVFFLIPPDALCGIFRLPGLTAG